GMLAFIPGGAGGIINASHQLNAVIHNTIWVTGHFHLTIATTVMLTFFVITYWLVPHLTGRTLTKGMNRLGGIQAIIWTVVMSFMLCALHIIGLVGALRLSAFSQFGGTEQASHWISYRMAQAIGGSILFIGILLMVYILLKLAFFAPIGETEFPIAQKEPHA